MELLYPVSTVLTCWLRSSQPNHLTSTVVGIFPEEMPTTSSLQLDRFEEFELDPRLPVVVLYVEEEEAEDDE